MLLSIIKNYGLASLLRNHTPSAAPKSLNLHLVGKSFWICQNYIFSVLSEGSFFFRSRRASRVETQPLRRLAVKVKARTECVRCSRQLRRVENQVH